VKTPSECQCPAQAHHQQQQGSVTSAIKAQSHAAYQTAEGVASIQNTKTDEWNKAEPNDTNGRILVETPLFLHEVDVGQNSLGHALYIFRG
jgi:hypothetical protein